MAFSEIYCTPAGGGGHTGSEAEPYDLAEGLTNGGAGIRLNVKSSGAYSLGADTVAGGSAVNLSVVRGYNSTIGDLEGLGRNANGTLNTTGFPAITLTGILTPLAWAMIQNLNITGALSSRLMGSTTADNWGVIGCAITNSQNNGSAACIQMDNSCYVHNSDLTCSGAAHGTVLRGDAPVSFVDIRVKGTANSVLVQLQDGVLAHVVLIGNNTGIGVSIAAVASIMTMYHVTAYNLATAFQLPNALPVVTPQLIDCHATDCTKYIDGLYAGTASVPIVEINQRTRDNATPRTGIGDGINIGEITTDTGGIETDYTAAGSDNLTLIAAAPGVGAGLVENLDCGGNQRAAGAGGGSFRRVPVTIGSGR